MMNAVRSGLPGRDLTTRILHSPSSWVFSLPEKVEGLRDRFVSSGDRGKRLAGFLGRMVDWDFNDFQDLKKLKGFFTSAPLGAACFLFFGAMMSSRLFMAWKRGKENGNDFREVKDILFRDTIAISLFVFGLEYVTRKFTQFYQNKLPATGGLKLIDPKSENVLAYSRFANYRLDSEKALVGLIREGGADGLKLAIQKLYKGGLSEEGGEAVKREIDSILEKLPGLVDKVKATKLDDAKGQEALLEKAKDVYKHLKAGDGLLDDMLKAAEKTGVKQVIKTAKKLQGSFENAVIKYAQSRRLPADILGFALVVLMLGWFPGWFNAMRNKKDFERNKQAQKSTPLQPQQHPAMNPAQSSTAQSWMNQQQLARFRMAQQQIARMTQQRFAQPAAPVFPANAFPGNAFANNTWQPAPPAQGNPWQQAAPQWPRQY